MENGRAEVTLSELSIACRLGRGSRSLREAAEEAGVSASSLARIEIRDGSPSAQLLAKIAAWLDVDIVVRPEDASLFEEDSDEKEEGEEVNAV